MAAHGITLRYCTAAGDEVETPLDLARPDAIVGGLPIRTPPSYPGRTSYPGFFWSATTGRVHVYESLLELDRLWLADFDPAVCSLTTQPFQAIGSDGDVVRSHVPDLMLMSPDHRVTVVDVKPSVFLDLPKVKAQFDWTRRWCDERGWGYEVFSGADPHVLRNIKFLAVGRRPDRLSAEALARARHVVRDGLTWGAATSVDGRDSSMQVALAALVWSGHVTIELSRPLSSGSLLRVQDGAAA